MLGHLLRFWKVVWVENFSTPLSCKINYYIKNIFENIREYILFLFPTEVFWSRMLSIQPVQSDHYEIILQDRKFKIYNIAFIVPSSNKFIYILYIQSHVLIFVVIMLRLLQVSVNQGNFKLNRLFNEWWINFNFPIHL